MKVDDERYKHTFVVEVTTQFPKLGLDLKAQVKAILGPWCEKVEIIKLNEKTKNEVIKKA